MDKFEQLEIFSKETIDELKKYLKSYTTKETLYEYIADDNGSLKIAKKKVNKKNFPPNSDVLKVLFALCNASASEFSDMSEEQLAKEKKRLLGLLKEMGNDKNANK